MQDFDLEELESRLYSQVYHSAPETELVLNPVPEKIIPELSKTPVPTVRQVSTYSINNSAINKNRYWNNEQPNRVQVVINNEFIPTDSQETPTIIINNKIPISLPNEVKKNKKRKKKKKKNSTPQLNLCYSCRYQIKCTCRPNNSQLESNVDLQHNFFKFIPTTTFQKENSPKTELNIQNIAPIVNPVDKSIVISSESEDDVEIVPLPAKNDPVYVIESESDSDESIVELNDAKSEPLLDTKDFNTENIKNEHILKEERVEKINLDKQTEVNDDVICVTLEIKDTHIDLTDTIGDDMVGSNENLTCLDFEKTDKNIPKTGLDLKNTVETSFESEKTSSDLEKTGSDLEKTSSDLEKTGSDLLNVKIFEKERNELLCTPDSTLNDFIEPLNEQKKFNFNLHGSDMDLNEKEFIRPDPITHHTDVYETESSCSGHGTPTKNSFDLGTNTPVKDIFHEPELISFSNFITPNRNNKRKSEDLNQVVTKALKVNDSKEKKKIDRLWKKKIKLVKKIERQIARYQNFTESNQYVSNFKTNYTKKIKNLQNKLENLKKELSDIEINETSSDKNETNDSESENVSEECLSENLDPKNDPEQLNLSPPISETSKLGRVIISEGDEDEKMTENEVSDIEIIENKQENIVISSSDESRDSFNLDLSKNEIVLNLSSNSDNTKGECSGTSGKSFGKIRKNFSDYWTPNMEEFYDNSWGQENFDINAALNSMTTDASKWKIIDEDRGVFKAPGRRKYCLHCRELGHLKYNCPKFRNGTIKCSICGEGGHTYTRCHNLVCTTCGNRGGYHTTSCRKCAHYSRIQCNICNLMGHPSDICPDLWRRYHLTTTGNELKTSPMKLKPENKQWCSGCAQVGHLYHNCRRVTKEHFNSLPYVVSYDNVSTNKSQQADVEIPFLNNEKLSNITRFREELKFSNNNKYKNILQSLIRQCRNLGLEVYLYKLLNLEKEFYRNNFDTKKIGMLYQMKNMIKKAKRSY